MGIGEGWPRFERNFCGPVEQGKGFILFQKIGNTAVFTKQMVPKLAPRQNQFAVCMAKKTK